MTRREALKLLLLGNLAAPLFSFSPADAAPPSYARYCSGRLNIYNLHTCEHLSVQYMDRFGRLNRKAIAKLQHIFRCHHTNQVHPISPRLYMLLDAVRSRVGAPLDRPYLLVSGYRSKAYNRLLRENGHGVALKSYHLKGMAADIRMDGVPLEDIRRVAATFNAGGIGTYPEFIHLDVGPVRSW